MLIEKTSQYGFIILNGEKQYFAIFHVFCIYLGEGVN